MTNEWKNRILQLRYWQDEKEALEYVRLVDLAAHNCDLDTCNILMRTFVTDEDFGVQESVVSVLSSAKIEDYQRALLEELPRLILDAPEWSEVLVERELTHHLNQFKETQKLISSSARTCINEFLKREYFVRKFGAFS